METLLAMHNPVELSSLCGALGLLEPSTIDARKAAVMQYIRDGKRQVRASIRARDRALLVVRCVAIC
jgi:hypothetical protein